jgi:cytochrome c peroxidase
LVVGPAVGQVQGGDPGVADRKAEFKRPSVIVFPNDAPYHPQIATLGKMLFFDPRLSGAQNMSCASCHNPSFGWETPVEKAIGAMNAPLPRHAPTVQNLADARRFFWDGRADSLEEQAREPIAADNEMNAVMEDVLARLSAIPGYRAWFARLFPSRGLTEKTVLQAIATYERTIQTGISPFDRWVDGEPDAISEAAIRGFELFIGSAGCAECHRGWNFTDHAFHDIGLPSDDPGRGAVKPGEANDFAFKTPGLLNIFRRAPYMHDGSLPSLDDVIRHYMSGGVERPSRDPAIRPFDLSERDIADLIAFLQTLTEEHLDVPTPVLPAAQGGSVGASYVD